MTPHLKLERRTDGEAHDMPKARILIVDDDDRTALAVTQLLEELGQILVVARSGEEALRCLLHDDFAVILMDLNMPGMDGYETATLIRQRKRSRHIPIVFLTAVLRDDTHLLQAYTSGAVDMVFKPVDPFILKSKVTVFVELYLKQDEFRREADLRHRLQEENFRVRTEKLFAEQALRRSQQRQDAILESLPVCFHARAAQSPFGATFVSGTVEQLTGFPVERFLEDPAFGLSRVHPDDLDRLTQTLSQVATTGVYSCEFRWRCPKGNYRWFLDQGVLAVSEFGAPEIFGTMVDVTERRLLEQKLVQAQKMETVGQLTGGIAHDFNNLLTVVLGNIDLLKRQGPGDEKVTRKLSAMQHAAERGQRLTSQLLAFSRRQHLSPEALDINVQLRAFEPLIRRAVSESIALQVSTGEKPAICHVDPAQLENSLLNLAVNARDAMPDGGQLSFEVSHTDEASELTAQYVDAASGPWVVVTVRDNGVGISEDIQSRVFEPFFTTKESGKGSGLGLSQVYGFVRQSGGYVTLSSRPSEGTRLSIYLPASDKPAIPARQVVEEDAAPANSEVILLVEDDASVQALTTELLIELGYRVITASDANAALEILKREDRIDLMLTDIVMPGGKTGVQLAMEVRAKWPEVSVVLISGYTGEALSRHQPDKCQFPLLAKPFRRTDLARELRHALEKLQPAPRVTAA